MKHFLFIALRFILLSEFFIILVKLSSRCGSSQLGKSFVAKTIFIAEVAYLYLSLFSVGIVNVKFKILLINRKKIAYFCRIQRPM